MSTCDQLGCERQATCRLVTDPKQVYVPPDYEPRYPLRDVLHLCTDCYTAYQKGEPITYAPKQRRK